MFTINKKQLEVVSKLMTNNTIIITGGAQRVGLASALALHDKGYHLVITYRRYRDKIKELEALGISCVQADFAKNEDIAAFIDWVKTKVTNLRAIIHNASDWKAESDEADPVNLMNQMMQVHVQTPYQLNLALKDCFKPNSAADIIHITDYAVETGSQNHIAYCASKAALANLTLSFATKYAPDIKVNTIAPSLIIFNQGDSQAYKEKTLNKSLLGIEPGTQEIVAAIEFILSSHYMTGRTLKLDGGRHLA